jgi:hypothetical protein
MLKIGVNNFIGTSSVFATSSATGRPATAVKDSTISHWRAGSVDATLTVQIVDAELGTIALDFGGALIDVGNGEVLGSGSNSIDLVSLHRVNFADKLTVKSYFVDELISEQDYNRGDLSGIETFHLFSQAKGIIDKVEFIFSGGTVAPTIGYIWVGSMVDFKTTAYQDEDNSGDIASVSQGGFAGNSRRPLLRAMTVTLAHESSTNQKEKIRKILRTGYSVPRPFARIEPCTQSEVMLGILDSKKVGYDFFDNKDQFGIKKSQATIGIAEVLGGI